MSPDTQQNILFTLYFIIIHNYVALFYALGIVISILMALYKPTRSSLIMLLGFIVLLFAFEYQKHILEGLREQTINSLITIRQSYRIERYIDIFLVKLVPLALPVFGWMMVLGSIILRKSKWDTQAFKKKGASNLIN